jgi:hypothetical protein
MRRAVPPRLGLALGLAALVTAAGVGRPARAQDTESPDVQLFDPLVTRNPAPERELEITVSDEKGRDGHEVETEVELAWRVGRRLELRAEAPLVILLPREGADVGGLGDVSVGAKVLLYESAERAALVSVGTDLGLPTGSAHRGLGGSTAVTPYLAAGMGLGPLDVIGEVNYTRILGGADAGAEEVQVNLAAAYTEWRRVMPLLELAPVTQTRSGRSHDEEAPDLVGRPQACVTPGVIVRLPAGTSVRAGVQVAVTGARKFDSRLLAVFNWEF